MSTWYNDVKTFYEMDLYSKDDVKIFVEANMITAEEYEAITGEVYTAS